MAAKGRHAHAEQPHWCPAFRQDRTGQSQRGLGDGLVQIGRLAQAALAAGMDWDNEAAHAAAYDAERTAELFCQIVNRFRPIYAAALPVPAAADEIPVEEEPPLPTAN